MAKGNGIKPRLTGDPDGDRAVTKRPKQPEILGRRKAARAELLGLVALQAGDVVEDPGPGVCPDVVASQEPLF